MLIVQNEALLGFMRSAYTVDTIQALRQFLKEQGTLTLPSLANGLFPAANTDAETLYTGYSSVWVRDNIYVAHAYYVCGELEVAVRTVLALKEYFEKHRHRFVGIIAGEIDSRDPMKRPHIRFDGNTLDELEQKWAHAQNDALGYFLWLYSRMAADGTVQPGRDDIEFLLLFPRYFEAVRYWEDEDSGHWEEVRKISASSMGVVLAGLSALRDLLEQSLAFGVMPDTLSWLDDLIAVGNSALLNILPNECTQREPIKYRRYDSALLFLIYPLGILSDAMSDQVLADVISNLQGDYGIRRYLGDSYWSADYKKQLPPESRTSDFSDNMAARDALLKEGEEAQWCIFDPIVSAIYGLKFDRTDDRIWLQRQTHYLNRSLGQITGPDCPLAEFLCPESYYLEEGRYVPSDPTPLLWTQANLKLALMLMERSLRKV